MTHVATPEIQKVLSRIAPRLDDVLYEGPLSVHQHMGENYDLPRHLKRRGGICNATSWLLAGELQKQNIYAAPHAKMSEIYIGERSYMVHHVVVKALAGDGRFFDATYQQFYKYVGLNPQIVQVNPELVGLYPENDIAIIDPATTEFQENFAESAHRIEHELAKRSLMSSYGAILRGTTLEEKVDAYKQIWDMDTYKSMFPPNIDMRRAIRESGRILDRSHPAT